MVRKLVIAVAAASALMSTGMVQALGVGDINLRSSLNQPLDAEIDLLQVRDLSSEEIRSMLASPDDFGRAGIERSFFLTDLKFTPIVKPNGKSVIRVTSSRPVNEPYLNFLMEVRWPSGKVLREFTVLLDPPLYQPASVVGNTAVSAPSSSAARITPPQPTIAPAQPRGNSPYQQPAAQPSAAAPQRSSTEWRTNRADTLWEVALQSRPSGASVHQTMLAIQDLNAGAFINGNINQLKSGQTLKLPTSEQAARRSGSEAVAEVAAQNRAWQEGRNAPASAPASTAVREPSAPQLDARQRESAGSAPEQVDGQDSLRLVSGEDSQVNEGAGDGSASTSNTAQLRDSLDRTKEQLDAAEREKAEMGERLGDVQGQLETLQRLLELKDAQLAALQQDISTRDEGGELASEPQIDLEEIAALEQEQQADAGETPEAVEAVVEPAAQAQDADAQEAGTAELDPVVDADESAETIDQDAALAVQAEMAAQAEAEAEVISPAAEVDEVDSEVPPATEQPESEGTATAESLLERMMQNQMLLIGGGVVAILLLMMVLMAVSRRNARREEDLADNFIANAAEGRDRDLPADESDDFNVALAASLESEDAGVAVDPLTEADALLAYGKPQSAQAVLLAALESEPERTDLRLKLMEVEGLLENAEGYRAQHEALRAAGTVNEQVDTMDARFPLMAAAVAGAAAGLAYGANEDDDLSFELPAEQPQTVVVEEDDMDFDFSEFEMGESVDVDTGTEPASSVKPDSEADFDLDFDLDDTSVMQDLQGVAESNETESAASAPDTVADNTSDEMDVSLDFSEFENLDAPANAAPGQSALDDDFDLSLTEDLQSDSLAADFEAVEAPAESKEESLESFNLSEEDLAGFEVELDEAAASAEQADVVLPLDKPELNEDEDEGFLSLDNLAEQPVDSDLDEDDEFDFLSGTDESATKLDLARAYIDMGDSEGARDILNEVVDEGNEQQQQEARSMMERLTD